MKQLYLLWVNEANKQVIGPIVTKKQKNNQIWQWINKRRSEKMDVHAGVIDFLPTKESTCQS
jgi:hypothetical protein